MSIRDKYNISFSKRRLLNTDFQILNASNALVADFVSYFTEVDEIQVFIDTLAQIVAGLQAEFDYTHDSRCTIVSTQHETVIYETDEQIPNVAQYKLPTADLIAILHLWKDYLQTQTEQ